MDASRLAQCGTGFCACPSVASIQNNHKSREAMANIPICSFVSITRTSLQEIPHFVTSTPHSIPRTPALHFKGARTQLQQTCPYLIYFLSLTKHQVVSIFALIIRSQPTSSLQRTLVLNQTLLLFNYPFRTRLQGTPDYPFYSQPFANLNAHDACLLLFLTWNTTYYQRKVNR